MYSSMFQTADPQEYLRWKLNVSRKAAFPAFYLNEMLDRQRQRVDVPAHARTAHAWWPPAEKTGRGSLLNRPSCPPVTLVVKGLTNWTEHRISKRLHLGSQMNPWILGRPYMNFTIFFIQMARNSLDNFVVVELLSNLKEREKPKANEKKKS